jgi:transposase
VNPETICNRCLSLVGLADVVILDVEDVAGAPLRVHVELTRSAQGCPMCGVVAHVKDRRRVELVDLSMAGRPMRLVWVKRRFMCPESSCPKGSWTEDEPRIASRRLMMTDRAGRWITEQVGRCARSVAEVARELGCDWHTVNDAVLAYGSALVEDPDRFGAVEALGLDEVLMVRRGPWRRQEFSTQLVDVGRGQLLDVVPGRSSTGPMVWLATKGTPWCDQVRFATLDLSGPYRKVFTLMTPTAVQVADPFHLVTLANTKLDECRRRVQNETLGHYAGDPVKAGPAQPHPTSLSSRSRRPSKIFCRPTCPLLAASCRWRSRVGLNSTVVTKKVHDSQIDSKWQSSSTGRAQ